MKVLITALLLAGLTATPAEAIEQESSYDIVDGGSTAGIVLLDDSGRVVHRETFLAPAGEVSLMASDSGYIGGRRGCGYVWAKKIGKSAVSKVYTYYSRTNWCWRPGRVYNVRTHWDINPTWTADWHGHVRVVKRFYNSGNGPRSAFRHYRKGHVSSCWPGGVICFHDYPEISLTSGSTRGYFRWKTGG